VIARGSWFGATAASAQGWPGAQDIVCWPGSFDSPSLTCRLAGGPCGGAAADLMVPIEERLCPAALQDVRMQAKSTRAS